MTSKDVSDRSRWAGRRTFARAASFVGWILAVAGCQVGPDFKKPEAPVAPKWSGNDDPRIATQTAADSLWWKEFNDSTLDRLVELSLHLGVLTAAQSHECRCSGH